MEVSLICMFLVAAGGHNLRATVYHFEETAEGILFNKSPCWLSL